MANVEVIKAKLDEYGLRKGSKIEQIRVAAYCRVSTDTEEQLESYKSQVQYYTELIESRKDWILVKVYADQAITGTKADIRDDFMRLIHDCMVGKIDMIITKSISRFARNTMDVLKYVRLMRDKNIPILFEDEHINTSTMDGELLLSILSAVYQQEVQNVSANVKKGLKMKMQRGELVGFNACLGYDYHPETKTITVNEEEAKVVRYIFKRYLEGVGGVIIARELDALGVVTPRDSKQWTNGSIIRIIKNEKYKGDLLAGKTFTVDPIAKKRMMNFGDDDQFYIKNHHEAIISQEDFDKAAEIRARRNRGRNKGPYAPGEHVRLSKRFVFSCLIKCGFCGFNLTRRSWHSGFNYNRVIWQCITSTKKGVHYCPHSKGIPEELLMETFVKAYTLICQDHKGVLDEFMQRARTVLKNDDIEHDLQKANKAVEGLKDRINKLIDLRLTETVSKADYEEKYRRLRYHLTAKRKAQADMVFLKEKAKEVERRLNDFERVLKEGTPPKEFDKNIFESILDRVIVGGIDENGEEDAAKITFVLKTGLADALAVSKFATKEENKMCQKITDALMSNGKMSRTISVENATLNNADGSCLKSAGKTKSKCSFYEAGT